MSNKSALNRNNAILEQLQSKADYIRANYQKAPSGNLVISANGTHDVRNYATASVAVPGGSWGGEYDLIVAFGAENDMGENVGDYKATGYCTIDGGSPIYFERTSTLELTEAVSAGSTVTVFISASWGYPSNQTASGCAINLFESNYEDGITLILSGFTGDANVYAGIYG